MDYEAIIEGLTTEKVIALLRRLGVNEIIEKDNCLITNTICHNEDASSASMKLYYYPNNKIFMCYSECQGMSIFKFLKHYYETRGIDYDWYNDIYRVVLDCSNFNNHEGFTAPKVESLRKKYEPNKIIKLPEYNSGVLDIFVKHYPPEWLEDGITPAAMDKFNIKYSIAQNKIIIPHLNVDGKLVGVRGRALNEWEIENVGKYAPIKIEDTWYKHPLSLNLYGLYENKKNIINTGVCYIFESEKSVMQMEGFDLPNCAIAVCGSQLNKYQLKILLKHCKPKEIIICFDKEEKPKEDKYFYKLWNMCQKYKQYANFSFVYDRFNLLDLKDSPTDKGEEIFKKLIEKRTFVR